MAKSESAVTFRLLVVDTTLAKEDLASRAQVRLKPSSPKP